MKEQELSIETEYHQHCAAVKHGLESIDLDQLQAAANAILYAIGNRATIYTAGNGASASIAQHWACDYTKGCSRIDDPKPFKPRVISLSANIPLMTAISNDISYDQVYSYQLDRLANVGDVFISISSSGNSPSVVEACRAALQRGMTVIALTGFEGGKTRELAHHAIHVDLPEYEATEDVHQAIMHMIAKYIRAKK
jgi:D-sedoheptulose 7-phosphate isomerase/D-glycero-D-manno-heptose 1,7-bisphosphate phosphatase